MLLFPLRVVLSAGSVLQLSVCCRVVIMLSVPVLTGTKVNHPCGWERCPCSELEHGKPVACRLAS